MASSVLGQDEPSKFYFIPERERWEISALPRSTQHEQKKPLRLF